MLFRDFAPCRGCSRQLQDSRALATGELRQQDNSPVGKLKGIVVGVAPVFVDLAEDGCLVNCSAGKPKECGSFFESQFSSGTEAHSHIRFSSRREATSSSPTFAGRDAILCRL
jgi:hypothetical protein